MKKQLMQQVTQSIFKVMETMFFLTVEEQKKGPGKPLQAPQETKACCITFSGSFSGSIFLEIPTGLLNIMTENFMGQDLDYLSEDYVEGTLKEALNMIAGDALTQIDAATYMGLGIPDIVNAPLVDGMDETARFATANGTITAHIKLN